MDAKNARDRFRCPFLLGVVVASLVAVAVGGVLILTSEDDEPRDEDETAQQPPPAVEDDEKVFGDGDWVAIDTAEDCAPAINLPPARPDTAEDVISCLPDGTVLKIVQPPLDAFDGRYWALSGVGWVREQDMTFDHKGEAPYPARPQLRDQGLIAYSGADGDLWLMNADGSQQRSIGSGPVVELEWSPDGTMIAFGFYDQSTIDAPVEGIRVVDTMGSVILELNDVPGTIRPFWSPDSRFLAVSGSGVFDLAGNVVLETPNGIQPSWSADGTKLAVLELSPDETLHFPPARGAYYELADGSRHPLGEDESFSPDAYYDGPPLWRPQSQEIAYRYGLTNVVTTAAAGLPGPVLEWSKDGRYALMPEQVLGSGSIATDYVLYDLVDFELVERFEPGSCECDAANWEQYDGGRFSPDGRYFASLGASEMLDLETRESYPFTARGGVAGYSRDGQYVLLDTTLQLTGGPAEDWILLSELAGGELIVLVAGSNATWQPTIKQAGTEDRGLRAPPPVVLTQGSLSLRGALGNHHWNDAAADAFAVAVTGSEAVRLAAGELRFSSPDYPFSAGTLIAYRVIEASAYEEGDQLLWESLEQSDADGRPPNQLEEVSRAELDAAGRADLSGLSPGQYVLLFVARWAEGDAYTGFYVGIDE